MFSRHYAEAAELRARQGQGRALRWSEVSMTEGTRRVSYRLFSAWPSPDLGALGLAGPETSYCMLRAPGWRSQESPAELEVVEVSGPGHLRHWELAFRAGFGIPLPAPGSEPVFRSSLLKNRHIRLWLGLIDGRPVSCAAAYQVSGVVVIDHVATVPDVRGRGYASALTWRATRARPDVPAILEASDMGRPVYERLGYQVVGTATTWQTIDRGP
jgi:hypothetical protein